MRCPKCGFISFDNVRSCSKCNKDISETAKAFPGGTYNVAPPAFLKFAQLDGETGGYGDNAEDAGEIDFADPDLEILVDSDSDDDEQGDFDLVSDSEASSEGTISLSEGFGEVETFGESSDADDSSEGFDLGLFEDASEDESFGFEDESAAEPVAETPPPVMDIPDELADISDLSPPAFSEEPTLAFTEEDFAEPQAAAPVSDQPVMAEPEDDLDFSSLDMDLSLGNRDDEPLAGPVGKQGKSKGSSMDDDLDFDLDLGGLSIHEDK